MLVIFLVASMPVASCLPSSRPNPDVVEYLKKSDFGLEFYELVFCVEELFYVMENDSTYLRKFGRRLKREFEQNFKTEHSQIRKMAVNFFLDRVRELQKESQYPASYKLVKDIKVGVEGDFSSNYAELFKGYIAYPEQVDDIVLMTLILSVSSEVWNDIQSDKSAMFRFNSWIEYGFVEFRYYPGTKTKGKGVLNDRIIDFLFSKHSTPGHQLIEQSLEMIRKVQKKYAKSDG